MDPRLIVLLTLAMAVATDCTTLDPRGCNYEGTWYADGSGVPKHEACLRCVCAAGALSCSRRSCADLPDPLPSKCHLLHRKGACCPELRCPDMVMTMERGASPRFQQDDYADIAPRTLTKGSFCVEGGTIYVAGSAMSPTVACEQCFCLGGSRRCVRPQCLPPPAGCKAKPTPGACCPQRYYCQHGVQSTEPSKLNPHDCSINGQIIPEGERVVHSEQDSNCTQCFCLRGSVRCQTLACAPPLHGCQPLLRPGQCCPHQYQCHNENKEFDKGNNYENNKLERRINEKPFIQHPNKVKRKTSDELLRSLSQHPKRYEQNKSLNHSSIHDAKDGKIVNEEETKTNKNEPDAVVKITVNGTVNCTTEISSNPYLKHFTAEEIKKIEAQSMSKSNINRMDADDNSFDADDLITNENFKGFDENDSFVVNVTSSLRTNTSGFPGSVVSLPNNAAGDDKTKLKEYNDYDEPTLPPSLPNLKIIPFVAADAVVDNNKPQIGEPPYKISERQDDFPVYYQGDGDTPEASGYSDAHKGSDKNKSKPGAGYSGLSDLTATLHEYTVSASLANRNKPEDTESDEFLDGEASSDSLFSPPVETEGGFIPKGPGPIEEYYAVYPSSSLGPQAPLLTTSMPLDPIKHNCIANNGQRVPAGGTISIGCSICTCAWGDLHCSPTICLTPPGCERKPDKKSKDDICCGDLVCTKGSKTTSTAKPIKTSTTTKATTTKIQNPVKTNSAPIKKITTTPKPLKTTTLDPKDKLMVNITSTTKRPNENIKEVENVEKKPQISSTTLLTTTTNTPITYNIPKDNRPANEPSVQEKITNNSYSHNHDVEYHDENHAEYEDHRHEEEQNPPQEYEEEEDDGFSFGSVLKLLLSDYESTTAQPKSTTSRIQTSKLTSTTTTTSTSPIPPITSTTSLRSPVALIKQTDKPPSTKIQIPSKPLAVTTASVLTKPITTRAPSTFKPIPIVSSTFPSIHIYSTKISSKTTFKPTRAPFTKPTVSDFIPLPPQNHHLYSPSKNYTPTSVNRIDHLVLGEATAIKTPTSRPVKPVISPTFKPQVTSEINYLAFTPTRPAVVSTNKPMPDRSAASVPNLGPMLGPGLLKLDGCNVYGKMYRVGPIIPELSTPCQECRCTDFGVQCRNISC